MIATAEDHARKKQLESAAHREALCRAPCGVAAGDGIDKLQSDPRARTDPGLELADARQKARAGIAARGGRQQQRGGAGRDDRSPRQPHSASLARAALYSASSRSTRTATDSILSTTPMPWPDPQMSFHALALLEMPPPKFIVDRSPWGKWSGSIPAATIDPRR